MNKLPAEIFNRIYSSHPIATAILSLEDGSVLSANESFFKMFGIEAHEIIGYTLKKLKISVSRTYRKNISNIIREKKRFYNFPIKIKKRRGDILEALLFGTVINFEEKEYLIISLIEIKTTIECNEFGTVKIEALIPDKEIEEQLKEEKEKFSILIKNAPFGLALIDKDGRFLYVNPKFTEIFGYDLKDIPDGKTWFRKAYPDPEYRHTVIEAWIKDMEKARVGEQRPRTFNVICKDKSEKIIHFIPVQLESGLQIVSFEDITTRVRSQEALELAISRLRRSFIGTIQIISSIIEVRDPYTAGHQKRVSALARAIAQELGLSNVAVENIRLAASIHDIGKISVPAEILSKPGRLSDIEMNLIKTHPEAGYNIIKDSDLPFPIAEIVLQHHERLNGSGYPKGLKGDEILFEAKIVAVADVVEAISSYRPYRPANGIEIALEEIEKNKGILYDEYVVEACLKLFKDGRFCFDY